MPETLVLRFAVTGWDTTPVPGVEGDWVAAVRLRKTYTAGLIGSSEAHFVSSGDARRGRGYLAAERIEGRLDDGRSGALTVHHGALHGLQSPSAFGWIVPGAGSGDFAEWAGTARVHHDEQGQSLVLEVA